MTVAALSGTLDAGSPRVRFDEAGVALVESRCGSLLYSKSWLLAAAALSAGFAIAADINFLGVDSSGSGDHVNPVTFGAMNNAQEGSQIIVYGGSKLTVSAQLGLSSSSEQKKGSTLTVNSANRRDRGIYGEIGGLKGQVRACQAGRAYAWWTLYHVHARLLHDSPHDRPHRHRYTGMVKESTKELVV